MITQSELKDRYYYNPDTGLFTRICKTNGRHFGKTLINNKKITIKGKAYLPHRLAWLYMTGQHPKNFIDHINRDSTDNRFNNLREATYAENNRNRSIGKDNTSGYKGVSWHKGRKKWRAEIRVDNKSIHLGYFDDIKDAGTAYIQAANIYHKEFATNGL
jgi:hypothetical protein